MNYVFDVALLNDIYFLQLLCVLLFKFITYSDCAEMLLHYLSYIRDDSLFQDKFRFFYCC